MKCKTTCPECGANDWWEYTENADGSWEVERVHGVWLDHEHRHPGLGPWETWWECQNCGLVVT